MTASPASVWSDAMLAAALFAIDPAGLGGVVVRGFPGPVRDLWQHGFRGLLPAEVPVRRIPLGIGDDRLLGGLDLAATLTAGRPVAQRGVLAEADGGVAVLPMAERLTEATAGRLAMALDRGELAVERDGLAQLSPTRIGLLLLDEGLEPEERPPEALMERLAFHIDLGALPARGLEPPAFAAAAIAGARSRLHAVGPPDAGIVEALCSAALLFGVSSIRAPILALAAARAHAALGGSATVTDDDAAVGARLVLGPRAVTCPAETPQQDDLTPQPTEEQADPAPPPSADSPPPQPDGAEGDGASAPPTDMMIEAVKAMLDDGLLEQALAAPGLRRDRPARKTGAGAAAKSTARGRPVGSRAGVLRAGERLNLVDTLRAAAPWQRLRRATGSWEPGAAQVLVTRDDFRIRRFVQRAESTTIFVVDASGSAAFERLAEAKGAVELLLAKAYVSRAHVALIAFRDRQADVVLPSTRSLTRAKRHLAEMPGGGGTPLAAGMDAALQLGLSEKARDRTPVLVFLTDGRANIARDGAPGRAAAELDAMASARQVCLSGMGAVFVDTSARAQAGGDRFARAMGAVYAPLPYVEANALAGLVEDGARRR